MSSMQIEHVKLGAISFDDGNERGNIDVNKFTELKNSMAAHGLINPIRIRPTDGGYVVVAGARRTLAAIELGWSTIPAIISSADEAEDRLVRVHENLQREDLSIEDEAKMLNDYMAENSLSQTEAARSLSRSPEWVRSRMSYYQIDDDIRQAINSGEVSLSVATELWKIDSKTTARRLIDMAIRNGCSVSTARAWRSQYNADTSQTAQDVQQTVGELPHGQADPILFECRFCRGAVPLDSMDVVRICQTCSRGLDDNM